MKRYLSDSKWLIKEKKYDFSPEKQQAYETMFTLGNGYMGVRGVLEEIPEGSAPGTYIAGIFDKSVAQVEELINLPNALDFRVASEGEKLDVGKMQVISHYRALDLKRGFLYRKTLFKDAKKRKIKYESLRFVSYDNPHLIVMKIKLTALNSCANLMIQDCVDDSITNKGGLLEGRKRHVRVIEADGKNHTGYLCLRSYTYKTWIAYSSLLSIKKDKHENISGHRVFSLKLNKNQSATITKYITLHTSRDISKKKIKETSYNCITQAHRLGFNKLLKKHKEAWTELWKNSDVEIKGDKDIQRIVRFNIYHLLISASKWTNDASIAAKALSGEGYSGHIFWDTEIFILPFFILTNPNVAKKLLIYRCKRIEKAREKAAANNYAGALFPWESAATGEETTPGYSKDIDGSVIEIHTQDFEHHISADIAYAVYNYFSLTDDRDFMFRYGLEIIFETARFYASRVKYNKDKLRYEINNVIGPDEFHIKVNNNAFTNYMAKWNLLYAARMYKENESKQTSLYRRLKAKLKINAHEAAGWLEIANKLYIPFSQKKGIFEQFDGYFKKRVTVISKWEKDFIPTAPEIDQFKDIGKTQFVKQADVVMILFLFPQEFTFKEMKRNYYYYIERTLHKSSLSLSVHAAVASWLNDKIRAYVYFIHSALADLADKHGNVANGIHGASLGGTLQAVIRGFAGIWPNERGIRVEPHLPNHWKELKFKLKYRGGKISFKISQNKVKLNIVVYREPQISSEAYKINILDKDYNLLPKGRLNVSIPVKRGD